MSRYGLDANEYFMDEIIHWVESIKSNSAITIKDYEANDYKMLCDAISVKHGTLRSRLPFNTERLIYPFQCSECGHHAYRCEDFNDDNISYCPNCGVKFNEVNE